MTTPAVTTTATRRGPWRWFVALIATVLLVVSGSGLVVFAASGDAEAQGPEWVAADAPVYLEVRVDMAGGQGDAVAQMLTAFPLFADANSFELKMDEAFDGAIAGASGGAMTWTGDIEAVVTGEMGVAVPDLQSAMMGSEPTVLVGVAHSDAEAVAGLVETLAADAGMTQEMYGDTPVWSSATNAVAVDDAWLLYSQDAALVTGGLDVLAGDAPSLADDPEFQAAFARLASPRLGAAYVDFSTFGSILDMAGQMAAGQAGVDLPTADLTADLMAQLPLDMAASLSAEPDRLNLHAFITPGEQTMAAVVGESDLATLFPADTQIYVETRDLGSALEAGIGQVGELMAAQAESGAIEESDMAMVEMFLAEQGPIITFLGVPLAEFVTFVGDTAVGGGMTSDGISLGIAAVVEDDALANERVNRLMSIVSGMGAEAGVAIEEITVGDVSATAVTLPAEAMAGAGLPIDNTVTVAVADGHLLVGLGDFVETALTVTEAESLAASAGYTDALAGDTPNSGLVYANLGALLSGIDPLLQLAAGEQWSQLQPFATGLDRMILVGNADDEVISSRMSVIVDNQ